MIANARATYMSASVTTASPARLLVMLYERLVLDVQRGLDAQRAGQRQEVNNQLVHAQEIVMELRASLKVTEWEGGPGMASIYEWLHTQLVKANITNDTTITEICLSTVTELADTWRRAAATAAAPRTA